MKATALVIGLIAASITAAVAEEFPFGTEMTLDAPPMRGSKRIPNLEIGDKGEVVLELWCKGGKGQFSVANDTVIFVPGPMEDRQCSPERAAADDDLLAQLSDASGWRRQGNAVQFMGPKVLRFRINTN
ncbi:MAG: META domain-containing protein [Pseudomonadota bacterium]|jgi:hypothetical protein